MTESIVNVILSIISNLGYPGVFFLMTLESALIPIPSEVIMPFSGFLVSQGRFDMLTVVFIGTSGNLFGSWLAYTLGYWGHKALVRKLVIKYGKFILLTEEEYDKSVEMFAKYGQWVAGASRVLPGLRTVISLPAGVARLPFWRFSALTFFGSLIWSYLLTYIGFKLGQNWQIIRPIFRKFDIAIIIFTLILIVIYIYHKFSKRSK